MGMGKQTGATWLGLANDSWSEHSCVNPLGPSLGTSSSLSKLLTYSMDSDTSWGSDLTSSIPEGSPHGHPVLILWVPPTPLQDPTTPSMTPPWNSQLGCISLLCLLSCLHWMYGKGGLHYFNIEDHIPTCVFCSHLTVMCRARVSNGWIHPFSLFQSSPFCHLIFSHSPLLLLPCHPHEIGHRDAPNLKVTVWPVFSYGALDCVCGWGWGY